jgi:hypothetical protein
VRIGIRDKFDPPSTEVQKALAGLNSTVGYDFSLIIPWVDIHRDLSPSFPDISILIPSIGTALAAYLNHIVQLLDDQKFQDAFLEKMSSIYNRGIIVKIGDQTDKDESSLDKSGRLNISLPKTGPDWYRRMTSRIGHDLESVFCGTGKPAPSAAKPRPEPASASNNDWVDVSSKTPAVVSLPSLGTLGKPETLFESLFPYYIIVTNSGSSIHIQGSHQQTLELVQSYFQLHTRKNMNLTTQVVIS